jgi:DME family drug/metabolite transporter
VCLIGLALLTLHGSIATGADASGPLFALTSGLGYAIYTVAAKRLMNQGVHAPEVMASAFSLGGLILLPVLLFAGAAWIASLQGLAVALWLGFATTTVAYVLFGRGLRELPAGPVATLVLAEPLVATMLGVFLLGEHLDAAAWAGAALVAAGLGLQGVVSVRSRADGETNVIEAVVA